MNSSRLRLKNPGAKQAEVGRILVWEQCNVSEAQWLLSTLVHAHTTLCAYDAAVVSPAASRIGLTFQKSGDIPCTSASATLIAGRLSHARYLVERPPGYRDLIILPLLRASRDTDNRIPSARNELFVSQWHCKKPSDLEVFETTPPSHCHPRRENWER